MLRSFLGFLSIGAQQRILTGEEKNLFFMQTNKNFSKTEFLTVLPLLLESLCFDHAVFYGALTCVAWWITFSFFKWTEFLFPKAMIKTASILWLCVFGFAAGELFAVKPYWIISLAILILGDQAERNPFQKSIRKALWQGIHVWLIFVLLAAVQEILGMRLKFDSFQNPVGAFLILATVALCAKVLRRPGR